MCGILGIISENQLSFSEEDNFPIALKKISHRGPDHIQTKKVNNSIFGHVRLAILDTSSDSNQPFLSADGKNILVFNGEIFNYNQLRQELMKDGIHFHTNGDVEVLMAGLQHEGELFIPKLEGFFSFVFYNSTHQNFIAARDRYGEKPFFYSIDKGRFYFSSELRPLILLTNKRAINQTAFQLFHSFNYVPGNFSMIDGIFKLMPGQLMKGNNNEIKTSTYYSLPSKTEFNSTNKGKNIFSDIDRLLSNAVQKRLIADVSLGCFLSGGIDSSIVALIASQTKTNLHTFSLGFEKYSQYNETEQAERTSRFLNTNHQNYFLSETDFLHSINLFFDSIDEPFADSSAFNLFVLSKFTRQKVKAVLSGDGADELFAGYNKHRAMWTMNQKLNKGFLLRSASGLLKCFPSGRSGTMSNKIRQVKRYLSAAVLTPKERYWYLASVSTSDELKELLQFTTNKSAFNIYKNSVISRIDSDFNSVLRSDFNLVLEGDMLVKTDRMSMANGLEIRAPFLDHHLVDYVMRIPADKKLNKKQGKLLLRHIYGNRLPKEIFSGQKRGFEIPLEKWLKEDLKFNLLNDWLSDEVIYNQHFYHPSALIQLRNKAIGTNPEDSVARIWAVIVFLQWHTKNLT